MTENAATELCAACGCYCPPIDMRLAQDRDNGLARAGLTVTVIDGMRYCLEPAAYNPLPRVLRGAQVGEGPGGVLVLVRIDIGPAWAAGR